MSVERYIGQPLPIIVRYKSNPLLVYNKDYVDVTDVSMNFKLDLQNDLDDAYLEKKQSTGGVTIDEENHRFIMNLTSSDYANLETNKVYLLTLNIQVNGFTEMLEMPIKNENRKVTITPDTNRA